jgi:molybdopterin molybdotransferase
VFERVRVGVVSTGDEVVAAGSGPLGRGAVYDANTAMLIALSRLAGCEVTTLGIWRDDAALVRRNLAEAAERFDVVLTSGGASRGDEDHMSSALAALGTRHFWQISVKPGRPMMLGQVGDAAVVGLPGNPVAVFVCFLMYAWPLLRRLGGAMWREPVRLTARAAFAFPKRKTGRREFWRGQTRIGAHGLEVAKFVRDGSGLITSLRESDCLIDVPEDVPEIREGDMVQIIPYAEFGIPG